MFNQYNYHHQILQFQIKMMRSFAVFLIVILAVCEEPYKKIYPNLDPEAVCLDGSPGAIQFHQGSEPDKFLIFLYGGGGCFAGSLNLTVQQCYERSKTKLGSSKFWQDQYIGPGYLSTDPSKSQFATWSKALFIYCDGMYYQGYTKQPHIYKGQKIYARGSKMFRQNINWLENNHKLSQATKVVFAGISAGAIGVSLWSNKFQKLFKDPNIVDLIIDSGLFVNDNDGTQKGEQAMKQFANVDQPIPMTQCTDANPKRPFKCLWLKYNYEFINGRILMIDSQYDNWQIYYDMGVPCLRQGQKAFQMQQCDRKTLQVIDSNRNNRLDYIKQYLSNQKNSIWSIACSIHGFANFQAFYDTQYHRVPMNSNNTVKSIVGRFAINKQRINLVDTVKWPYNIPCAF